MRTIQLTHEQVQLLCQALGIAEMQFTNIYKTIIENTIQPSHLAMSHRVVSHYGGSEEQKTKANFYHEMASKISDLNIDIEQGKFDV